MSYIFRFLILLFILLTFSSGSHLKAANDFKDINHENLNLFLDKLITEDMSKYHIPGVSIVVIKENEVVFKKGYGYSNLYNQIKVDPDKSIFRIGSVSKPFTATVVMQLVENGKLDLNKDINEYLQNFKIKNKYPVKLTLHHLLTQSGGFDGKAIGLLAKPGTSIPNLQEYLKKELPILVREPGKIMSYANYGIALAGYIVEEVSGESFDQYVYKNIFTPLEMNKSTYKFSEVSKNDFVVGYNYVNGKHEIYENGVVTIPPTGAIYTTASDMGNFIIANLNEGKYKDSQILKPETLKLMHDQHFTNDKRIAGSAYGWWEKYENNLRLIDFDGAIPGVSSAIHLIPEKKVGYFISYNSNKTELRDHLLTEFLDTFFPYDSPNQDSVYIPNKDYSKIVGNYRDIGYSRGTIEKLDTLFRQFKIIDNKDGTLTAKFPSGDKFVIKEIDDNYFQDINEKDRYFVFKNDENQGQLMLYKRSSFEKLKWYEKTNFQIGFIIFLIAFNLVCFIWLVIKLLKIKLKKLLVRNGNDKLTLMQASLILLNLLFIVGLVVGYRLTPRIEFVYGVPVFFRYLLYLPILISVMTITNIVYFTYYFKRFSVGLKIFSIIILMQSLGFIAFLNYWNLL